MKPDILEEKTEELQREVLKIVNKLKDNRDKTPEFLNGVLIDFRTFSNLISELRHIRDGIAHLNHVFIRIQGEEADKRTNDFVTKLIKGDLAMPALERKK